MRMDSATVSAVKSASSKFKLATGRPATLAQGGTIVLTGTLLFLGSTFLKSKPKQAVGPCPVCENRPKMRYRLFGKRK